MDTLASPPAEPPGSPTAAPGVLTPTDLLRERSRWHRLGSPLIGANAGLFLTLGLIWQLHPSWLRVDSPGHLPLVWVCGLGATLLTMLILWLLRRGAAPLHGARSLDTNLRAMNRLEAAALLESQADPIARAQRAETAAFLAGRGPVRRGPDYLRILSWTLAALIVAHLATLTVWTRPWLRTVAAPVKALPTPPPAVPPKASITWKKPNSEIKASPVEEVPLEAVAESASGLRDLVLEASVNGEPRPGVPVPADALLKPGTHPVQTSLYLDQLNVEPYDMVSYFLRAKRVAKGNLPDTVSPVQFVEVKPFRDDIREVPGADGKSLFGLITALKVAQLNLLKQNFVLGHAEISHEDAVWKKEDARVGDEQAALGTKADEIIAKFIQDGVPATIVDLLQQSRTLMASAAEKIQLTKNMDALPMQGKSLGLITEIEKFFIKLAAKDGSSKGGPKNVKDPFEKPKDFEMKQRFETVAGGLEALAQEQLKLAHELAKADPKDPNAGHPTPEPAGTEPKKPDPNRIEGTFTERQTMIAQRIGALLNQQVLPPEVNTHLEGGQNHARESLRQLDADDIAQAREPAAAAARELRLAIQAMDRLGEDNANDKLADALNRLNKAADQAREAAGAKSDDAARKAADEAAAAASAARDELAEAARQQQETGSAQAAARLADAVRALDDPKLREALKLLHDQPRNEALANAAADRLAHAADQVADQRGGKRSSDEIAKLVERVERTRRNFERLAATQPGATTDHAAPTAGSPADAPGGEHSSDGLSGKANPNQEPGGEGQIPGKNGETPKAGAPSGPEAGAKAAHGQDGKGKDGKGENGKGKDGQGKGQGKEGDGKAQGAGKGKEGQGKGSGQEGEGEGEGQGQGQGSGEPTGEQASGGQPASGEPGQPRSGAGYGQGPGAGNGSGGQPSSDDSNSQSPTQGDLTAADTGKDSSATGGNGDASGARHHAGGARTLPVEQQAKELMDDLRDETLEARTVLLGPVAKRVLEDLHPDIHSPSRPSNTAVVAPFERIRAPLDQLITLLRAELDSSQRQHELTDQTQEKAPLAYGEAVADYYEQLSRDYQPDSTPAPAVPTASPTVPSPAP